MRAAAPPAEPLPPLVRERRAVEAAAAPSAVQLDERGADRLDVVGRDDDACAGVVDQLRGRALGRYECEDRALRGEVLEDLAGEDPAPATAGVRDQQQQRLARALEGERAASRHVVE